MVTKKEIERIYDRWLETVKDEPVGLKRAFVDGGLMVARMLDKDWISVYKAYPNDMRTVLIITTDYHVFAAYYLADAETWQSPYEDKEYHHVTHWRELPLSPNI